MLVLLLLHVLLLQLLQRELKRGVVFLFLCCSISGCCYGAAERPAGAFVCLPMDRAYNKCRPRQQQQ